VATITAAQFQDICSGVWRDRALVLADRGFLSGEAALMRAIYWRMCKSGVVRTNMSENYSPETFLTYQTVVGCMLELSANPRFDGAPFLQELCERYRTELCQEC
jgi:hypothetical protein